MKKLNNLLEMYKVVQKVGHTIVVPWSASRVISNDLKEISVVGDQISLGEDYVSLEEARAAIEWYANQLGGAVKWEAVSEWS